MPQVKLISSTPDPEKLVIYIARVSSDNQSNPEITKLINYLIKNKHWSPFEHAYFTFEIITSRAISAQLLRHKSFSFQELSQRYQTPNSIEPIELRKQATKNRQSSTEIVTDYDDIINNVTVLVQRAYNLLLDNGISKETARMILPMATQTRLYITGSIRSWIHYIELRTDEHTQKEHRIIAQEIKNILIQELPEISKALGWK